MTTESLPRAAQWSTAISELATFAARSVVLVRGSRGGAGSGVIWDLPRLILTNHHVVPGSSAEILTADGRRRHGRVVRRAPGLDLAALEVEDDLPGAAIIGDSETLRVGELVMAIGNPMGERNAPGLGIVAGAPDDVVRLAMTLRPGNSGGALVTMRGEVVGIDLVAGSGLAMAVATRTVRRFLSGAPAPESADAALAWV